MKIASLTLIGVGGTGSCFIEPAIRMLQYHKEGNCNITIIDGDKYEKKNLERQMFDPEFVNQNKAQVQADRLKAIAGGDIKVIPEYVDEEALLGHFADLKFKAKRDGIEGVHLVIPAVDNHASRHGSLKACENLKDFDFLWISPGNGYDDGHVVLYARVDGETAGVHPFERYANLKKPEDRIPGGGCAEEVVAEPQLLTANFMAAAGTMLKMQAWLDDKDFHEEIAFNCRTFKMKGVGLAIGAGNEEEVE